MLEIERDGRVATIRMQHGAVNALDLDLLNAVAQVIRELDADPDVGAMVLTGNGRAFCAGVDLKAILDGGDEHTREFLKALSAVFLAPLGSATPVIAAVDGHAIAGGAVLAAACDVVIGTDDDRARIGLAELSVGVPFPPVALEIMRRRLGSRFSSVVMTARTYPPHAAQQLGFLDEIAAADDLMPRCQAMAQQLAATDPDTLAATKRQLWHPVTETMARSAASEDARIAELWCSAPVRSAIRAFVDRTLGKGSS